MTTTYITGSARETKNLGKKLAEEILKKGQRKNRAHVLALKGELGGGKTTFLQGFARGLGVKERVSSPTFLIMKKFELDERDFNFFYHIDCYRIKKEKEILDLGFKRIISEKRSIIAIEWADRIKKILPPHLIAIDFKFYNKTERKIILKWTNKKD